MSIDGLTEAINNNAEWCAAVAASHGVDFTWDPTCWYSKSAMPPLYPNLVTLKPKADITTHIHTIDRHAAPGWGVKDSFNVLDLSTLGFCSVFQGLWYCRMPNQEKTSTPSTLNVEALINASQLTRWVKAWGENSSIFYEAILSNPSVQFLCAVEGESVVAGLAMNLSGQSVGVSNLFGRKDGLMACIERLIQQHPTRALVGYGDEKEVEDLSPLGFSVAGELQVWLRDNKPKGE